MGLNEHFRPGAFKLDYDTLEQAREADIAVKARMRMDSVLGKVYRRARRDGDLATIERLSKMGFTDYGIESRSEREARYREEAWQRRRDGDVVVGGGTPQAQQNGAPAPQAWHPPMLLPTQMNQEAKPQNRAEELKAKGAFGDQDVLAPAKIMAGERAKFLNDVNAVRAESDAAYGSAISDERKQAIISKGKSLGLNDDQIAAAMEGRDVTPSGIAKSKAEAESAKYAETDKRFNEIVSKLPPEQRKMYETLSPEERRQMVLRGKERSDAKLDAIRDKTAGVRNDEEQRRRNEVKIDSARSGYLSDLTRKTKEGEERLNVSRAARMAAEEHVAKVERENALDQQAHKEKKAAADAQYEKDYKEYEAFNASIDAASRTNDLIGDRNRDVVNRPFANLFTPIVDYVQVPNKISFDEWKQRRKLVYTQNPGPAPSAGKNGWDKESLDRYSEWESKKGKYDSYLKEKEKTDPRPRSGAYPNRAEYIKARREWELRSSLSPSRVDTSTAMSEIDKWSGVIGRLV